LPLMVSAFPATKQKCPYFHKLHLTECVAIFRSVKSNCCTSAPASNTNHIVTQDRASDVEQIVLFVPV
jgi:hypothetical protein